MIHQSVTGSQTSLDVMQIMRRDGQDIVDDLKADGIWEDVVLKVAKKDKLLALKLVAAYGG